MIVIIGKYQEWLEPDNLNLIKGWARDGLTNEQIAKRMGISKSTLAEWKKKHSGISDALKKSKEIYDTKVVDSLQSLTEIIELKEEKIRYEKGLEVERTVTIKQVAPNVTALIFWLKNRQPDKWRENRQESDTTALDKLDKIMDRIDGVMT